MKQARQDHLQPRTCNQLKTNVPERKHQSGLQNKATNTDTRVP